MKLLWLAALCCIGLSAQSLKFAYTTDIASGNASTPLGSSYSFPDAIPIGGSSTILVNITNSGLTPIEIITVCVGLTIPSCDASPSADFTIDGGATDKILAPKSDLSNYPFYLHFTPTSSGLKQTNIQVFTREFPGQPVTIPISGTASAEQLRLSYNNGARDATLFPFRTSRLDFGSVSTSATSSIAFTLTNETASTLTTPAVKIQTGVFTSSAFSVDTSGLPAALGSGASATFTVKFEPGQTVLTTATLLVGSNSYGIQGTGTASTGIDALQISYVDATGVRTLPQAATPISFGQLVPGVPGGATLTFTVSNPQTSFSAVTVTQLSVRGAAFTIQGAPSLPAVIQPNTSITFRIAFSANSSGTYTGSLTIGTRVFGLTGLAVVSPVPAMSLQFSKRPLTSGEQVTVTAQAASASTQDAIGTLSMQFTPTVPDVADDPAVQFVPLSSRNLSLDLAKGSQTATYQNQSALIFQTGTTAGTLTFTLSFVNTAPVTQTFTITPALIHISSAQAQRQDPNLVVTINGYDNTYSAGKMSFTFFDLKGKQINVTPVDVDATSNFHQLFFTNNQAGGAFALQAKFPVKGDITQIGSVAVTLTNSAGETNTNLTFQ
jgi:hypothetical protein